MLKITKHITAENDRLRKCPGLLGHLESKETVTGVIPAGHRRAFGNGMHQGGLLCKGCNLKALEVKREAKNSGPTHSKKVPSMQTQPKGVLAWRAASLHSSLETEVSLGWWLSSNSGLGTHTRKK